MLCRHIAAVCLATPSADNPLFHRKKRKETDIIKNVFIDEKIHLLFPPLEKGARALLHFLSSPPPHPNPLPSGEGI